MDSGFFWKGILWKARGRGPESGADCEVDWRGIAGVGEGWWGWAGGGLESGAERREKSHGEAQERPAI